MAAARSASSCSGSNFIASIQRHSSDRSTLPMVRVVRCENCSFGWMEPVNEQFTE